MKKLLSTALIAVMLSSTIVDTASAAVERRIIRSSRTGRQAPRRTIRRRRNLPRAQGKTSPEQLRKTAQQAERDAKKLQDDAKKSQTGKATEQTVVADAKKIEANIGKIEQQLANLRTWSGDVLPGGYSLEEKNKAFDIAAPFIKESEALKQRIKANQQKIDLITTKRYFGLGSPTVNKGKEAEYARYSNLIKTDETRLAKLEPIIAQQEVIMGKRRSNAIKGAYGVMAAAALVVGADLYTGGAISGAAATQLSSIASNVAYYTPSPISSAAGKVYGMGAAGAARLKAGWDYLRGNTPQQAPTGEQPPITGQPSTPDLSIGTNVSTGTELSEAMSSQIIKQAIKDEFVSKAVEQSALNAFGQELLTHVKRSAKATALSLVSKGVSKAMTAAVNASLTYVQALITDPTTDPKVLRAELKRLDDLTAKMEKEARTK